MRTLQGTLFVIVYLSICPRQCVPVSVLVNTHVALKHQKKCLVTIIDLQFADSIDSILLL